ncbi:MAG: hypothetical protein M0C28_26995 [Candidatus Moduliflexus flocculans]|nr:hypothetical protein [Candidatus Moduliflexus flocculans]
MFENDPASRNELDFGYGIPGVGRFRVNVHVSRGSVGGLVQALADRIPRTRGARAAAGGGRVHPGQARARPRHRTDGLRQVDDPGRPRRHHQPDPARPHPDHRGPDRVHPQLQDVLRHPARGRADGRHAVLPQRPASTPCARTPTSS